MQNRKRLGGLAVVAVVGLVLLCGLLWQNTDLFKKDSQTITTRNENQVSAPENLTHEEVLSRMFPDKNLMQTSNRQDCFYDKDSMKAYGFDNTKESFADVYCTEELKRGQFTDLSEQQSLAIVHYGISQTIDNKTEAVKMSYEEKYPTSPHVAGITHIFLGVFDKNNKLITENYQETGDSVDIKIFICDNKKYITATGGVMFQGTGEISSRILEIKNGKFTEKIIVREETFPDKMIDMIPDENGISVYQYNQQTNNQDLLYSMVWDNKKCEFEKQ